MLLLWHESDRNLSFQTWDKQLVCKYPCFGSKIKDVTSGLWWALLKTAFHYFLFLKLFAMSSPLQWWPHRSFDSLFILYWTSILPNLENAAVTVSKLFWEKSTLYPSPKTLNAGLNIAKGSGKPWYRSSGFYFYPFY